MRIRHELTTDQVIRIHDLYGEGWRITLIAKELNIPVSTIGSTLKLVGRHWSLKDKMRQSYKDAIKEIKSRKGGEEVKAKCEECDRVFSSPYYLSMHKSASHSKEPEEVKTETKDSLDLLREAFDNLEKVIVEVLDAEVLKRVSETQKENRELRTKVHEYEEAFQEIKRTNWIGNLRKKWQG
jgi:hypothetical protein